MKSSNNNHTYFAIILLIIGLLAGFLIGLNTASFLSIDNQDNNTNFIRVEGVSADNDPFIGSKNAPITIIEFSDFECQFCKLFYDTVLQEIKINYIDSGKVKFVYRDFPISSIHPKAEKAAKAANCAFEQNKFWAFHDLLFENQNDWISGNASSIFANYISLLGLDETQFNLCMTNDKIADEISNDIQDGWNAGVQGTPTLYINGIKIVGAQEYFIFKQVIESELKK